MLSLQELETRIRRCEIELFGSTDTNGMINQSTLTFRNQNPQAVRVYPLWDEPRTKNLSLNFKLGEFACNDGTNIVLVHPALIRLLENVRRWANRHTTEDIPVSISSGYRTPSYNDAIGGADESAHKLGMAADIKVGNKTPGQVAAYADKLNIGGLGRYNTFTHVDVYGSNRRW